MSAIVAIGVVRAIRSRDSAGARIVLAALRGGWARRCKT
jgi:hypothetical protein